MEIRTARPEDAVAIMNLVLNCYGTLAANQNFYLPELMAYLILSNKIKLYLAIEDNHVISMEACREECEFPGSLYMEGKMTLPDYRGKGIAKQVLAYMLSDNSDCTLRSFCAYTKGNTIGIQPMLKKRNFFLTGFVFNDFYDGNGTGKNSNCIMVRKKNVDSVGKIWLPEEQKEFVEEMYRPFQVDYEMEFERNILYNRTTYQICEDMVHRNRTIVFDHCGMDFVEMVKEQLSETKDIADQTIQVYLNMKDPGCVVSYHLLKKLGFVFTGCRPFCDRREYLVLYYSDCLSIQKDSLILGGEDKVLLDLL